MRRLAGMRARSLVRVLGLAGALAFAGACGRAAPKAEKPAERLPIEILEEHPVDSPRNAPGAEPAAVEGPRAAAPDPRLSP